ncbi:MAG: SCO family protein [Bdellovibrionaceae bacterium]|nr:SCO family protein [Bdellovibrio sp.]
MISYADNLSNGSTAMREEYTGKEPLKPAAEMPDELVGVKIEEKLGQTIDLNLKVTNEKGEVVALSSFFHAHKPVILSPVYFSCPGLCNFHLNGLTDTLKQVDWTPGNQFEVVAFSFDAREKPEIASKKKDSYLKVYGRPGTSEGWHFVTADQATITALTQQLGFNFKWNEKVQEWSHASAAIVVSPEGKISRYLHGIQFEPRDVKLALNEAANGKVGNIVDSVMLYCFKYDRHQSKYGLQVYRVMQLAGALTVAIFAIWLIPVIIRAKRENS